MVINEELTFVWDEKTIFRDEKGSPITVDRFKRNVWVYVEGVAAGKDKPILMKKIYTIPKLIRKHERHLYPFIDE